MKWLILLIGILILTGCTAQVRMPDNRDYTLTAQHSVKEYLAGVQTPTYTFNGNTPGPLLEATVGEEFIAVTKNTLDEPITVHWHGMQLPNEMDGVPDTTQDAIQPGETFVYRYTPVNPGVYWYHSHVDAHKQVEMGLQGAMIVHPQNKTRLADSDTVLVLDDVSIQDDGTYRSFDLNYMHGRFGNIMLVNGKQQPIISLQGTTHRLRLINTANARTFTLDFDGKTVSVIGEDIGRVQSYNVTTLAIHPGERYDIIVHTNHNTTISHITRRGRIPLANLNVSETMYQSPKWKTNIQNPSLPKRAITMEPTFDLDLRGVRKAGHGLVWEIGGSNSLTNPKTFEVNEGELVKIRLRNTQGQPHPMHLHGQKFIILQDNEKSEGYKDMVMVDGGETVDIAFIAEEKGEWVFHCHILEHSKAGMLSSVTVQ